jgi:hypothetical protein
MSMPQAKIAIQQNNKDGKLTLRYAHLQGMQGAISRSSQAKFVVLVKKNAIPIRKIPSASAGVMFVMVENQCCSEKEAWRNGSIVEPLHAANPTQAEGEGTMKHTQNNIETLKGSQEVVLNAPG